jgi:hypothetical protein
MKSQGSHSAYLLCPILESFSLEVALLDDDSSDIFQGGAPMLTSVSIDAALKKAQNDWVAKIFCSCSDLYQPSYLSSFTEQWFGRGACTIWPCVGRVSKSQHFSFSPNASPKYIVDGILNTIRGPFPTPMRCTVHRHAPFPQSAVLDAVWN